MDPIGRSISERNRRLEAIRRAMAEQGIDALIVLGTTGVGVPMNGNYAYLSAHVPIYASSLAYVPSEGEPVLFVPGENQHLEARATSWVDDVRLSPVPVRDLCAYLASAPRPIGRAGLSSFASMPAAATDAIRGHLDGAELVEASEAIFRHRAVKSADEQRLLKRASEIADIGFRRSLDILRTGSTELDWKAELERVMTAAGADGGFNMISAGRPEAGPDAFHGYVISPTARVFRDGDLALLEISPRVGGYYSQIVRLVSFGPVPPDIVEAHAACVRARQAALGALVPGTPFAVVAGAMERALGQLGHTMKDVAGAHTIGLDLSESIITLAGTGTIVEGMAVTLHPMIALDGGRQLFVGDTVLVGPSGPVALGEAREDIAIIGRRRAQGRSWP